MAKQTAVIIHLGYPITDQWSAEAVYEEVLKEQETNLKEAHNRPLLFTARLAFANAVPIP